MDMKEVAEGFDVLNRAFEEYKKVNDERIAKVEKGEPVADLEAKLEKIDADIAEHQKAQTAYAAEMKARDERISDLEAEMDLMARKGLSVKKTPKEVEYEEKFVATLRSTREDGSWDRAAVNELKALEQEIPELKAISGSSGPAGGVAMPRELSREIGDLLIERSPMRPLLRPITIGVRTYSQLLNLHGASYGWVGEEGSRAETDTSIFREVAPTLGTIYAYPKATEESLDDIFFDVAGFVRDEAVDAFVEGETTAILSGNGTNKPTGMLNTAPVSTADDASPLRAAAAYQYVPLSSASPLAGIQADELITLFFTLKKSYRASATWTMTSLTEGAIRKLKDSYGQYLWQPGLQAGVPSMLLGRPIYEIEQMDEIAAPAGSPLVYTYPIMFGDFRRAYMLVDRVGMRITVDDNITTPGYVKWYVRRRVGGIPFNNDALKVGRYSNS